MIEPLDVLAVMAHPDDAEIFCGGALIKSAESGERTGVLDLTAGEAGSQGTIRSRAREAAAATEVMGLADRRCAGLQDAGLVNDVQSRVIVALAHTHSQAQGDRDALDARAPPRSPGGRPDDP